jgi:hypothetical protein
MHIILNYIGYIQCFSGKIFVKFANSFTVLYNEKKEANFFLIRDTHIFVYG